MPVELPQAFQFCSRHVTVVKGDVDTSRQKGLSSLIGPNAAWSRAGLSNGGEGLRKGGCCLVQQAVEIGKQSGLKGIQSSAL